MEGHHRALAEADQRERRRRQSVARQLGIEKPLELRRGLVDAEPALIWIAEGERKPLATDRRLAARLRRMGRYEGRVRQRLLPGAADVDQVVAIGAVAVQEDDKLPRGSGFRSEPRTVEFSGHSCLFSVCRILPARWVRQARPRVLSQSDNKSTAPAPPRRAMAATARRVPPSPSRSA